MGSDKDVESGVAAYQKDGKAYPVAHRGKMKDGGGGLVALAGAALDGRIYRAIWLVLWLSVLFLGARASWIVAVVLAVSSASVVLAWYLARWVLSKEEGPAEMVAIADAIREGAEGFFRVQYGSISKMGLVLGAGISGLYCLRSPSTEQVVAGLDSVSVAITTVLAFVLGAVCSGVAGYAGMWVAVRANVRVASAARRSAREPLVLAVRAGGSSALLVVGMTVLGVALLYAGLCTVAKAPRDVPLLLVGYGFGASFVALFAQLGGGIYTKAADVGADLVGKVEQGIPEDDARNPGVIADLVGDNVGDCAARGADIFESIAAEIISAMILGGSLARRCGLDERATAGFVLFPLVVHSLDVVVSGVGILSITVSGSGSEDPMAVLHRAYSLTVGLATVGLGAATRWLLHSEQAPAAWLHFALCGLVGVATAYAFVRLAQYYTDYKHEPVRALAHASTTGHGTNIIAGVGLGLESTAAPALLISAAIVAAYWLGRTSGLTDLDGAPAGGLFGTAVATMGMLSTAAFVLTMDMMGPIADNAGGIAEMSAQAPGVRAVTDLLDAVGNTTKATTKSFAIGSAALSSFLLFSAYMDEVASFSGKPFTQVDIAQPELFVSGLLGAALIFLFSAWACAAVGRTAQEVVKEVRRQFSERPGILTFQTKPDYARCVSIVAAAALREMIKPGLLALLAPIALGVGMAALGRWTDQELLGAKAVAAMLMFATVVGILMALFLNTSGGAWDNAKKYIETGALGGKGSDAHKAAVTGDTVGDPFKDTAGPSLHVLIKMLATITLVMAPLFL